MKDLPEHLNYISEQEKKQMQKTILKRLEESKTALEKKISDVKARVDTTQGDETKMTQELAKMTHLPTHTGRGPGHRWLK